MNINDTTQARTIQDLIKKYNLAGVKKAVETQLDQLTKINNELNQFMTSTLTSLEELQGQIDGSITTYFYSGAPSLQVLPSSEWEPSEYNSHLGDLYYDTSTGKAYRFAKQVNTFLWLVITDNDVTEALSLAGTAQDTADNKRRVFVNTPIPPYDIGDLWVEGTSGDIKVCQTSKTSAQTYSSSDWVKASKYTDNSELNNFVNTIYPEAIQAITNQIDGKISTWYYSGVPTLSNTPANSWTTTEEKLKHTGDLYYDKTTGKSYIFQLEGSIYSWKLVENSDISEALSTANAAQDTADSKRAVFLVQPTTPYDAGDFWVNNGEIYICQISRATGSFSESDWVNNLEYTDDTVANAIVTELGGETTTVLNGTVIEKTNKWVKFTDLSTGGSTTIAGENITTGNIQSSNYVSGTSGTKFNLSTGEIDTPNVKIKQSGIELLNGTGIIVSDGVLSHLQYSIQKNYEPYGSSQWFPVGYETWVEQSTNSHIYQFIPIYIPENFKIKEAKLTLIHSPIKWSYDNTDVWGYCRNLKLYKKTLGSSFYESINLNSEIQPFNDIYTTEVTNAFGTTGFTASTASSLSQIVDIETSIDIKNFLTTGENLILQLRSGNSIPTFSPDIGDGYVNLYQRNCLNQTGNIKAYLNVFGYLK